MSSGMRNKRTQKSSSVVTGKSTQNGREVRDKTTITGRKQVEAALRESEDRYRDLFEHSQDLICIHDLQGLILSANPAIARLVGSSASDSIVKMNLRDLLAPEVRDQFDAYIAAIRRDGSASGLARIQTVSGEQRILEYHNTLRTEGVADPVVRGIAHDITERRRAEELLYENEQRFRQIAENLEDVLWMTDREARNVLYINPAYEAVWGQSCESLYRRQLSFVEAIHTDDREHVRRMLERQAEGKHEPFEYRIVKPDGSIRWIRDRSFPIRNNEGEVYRIAGLAEDITERKRAEEALLASELKYRNIFTFAPVGIYQSLRNGTLITVNKALAEMLAYDSVDEFLKVNLADVYFTEDEREKLIREYEDRGYATDLELRWKRKDGALIWVQLTAHAIKSTDGVTEYFEGFVRDITERKLIEDALRESEERYRDLVENIQDLVCTHDLEGRVLSANRALEKLLGYNLKDFGEKTFRKILAPEVRDRFDDYLVRIRKDGVASGLMLVQTSTGERRIWEYHNTLRTEGVARPIVRSLARDVTERKRAEAALRESETKFRVLAETAASAILMYQDDKLIYANPATAALTGYPVEELVGMSLWDLVHPDFKVVIMQRRRAREWGEPIPPRYETKIIYKGGKERWADYTIGSIQFEGKPTIIVTAFDTTERKLAEAALRESEERYRTLFETAPDAVGVFDTQLKLIMANRRAVEMFGYNNSAEMIGLSAFDIIAPQLRARVRSNAKRVLEMGGMPPVESIGVKKDGTQFAVESSATLIGNPQGKPMAILGVARDITERKQAEGQLRASEEQLRALSARLQSAREEEGTRIAREIHDELGGALTGLKWDLEGIDKVLSGAGNGAKVQTVREKLRYMSGLMESTIDTIRRISAELRPGVLDDLGLVAAIEWQAQQFQTRTGIKYELVARTEALDFDRERATAVFRIFQEILTNVIRHAHAHKVDIELKEHDGYLELRVKDDGRGITEHEKRDARSLGLVGMRERALLVGGEVGISGMAGLGTTVIARVPV